MFETTTIFSNFQNKRLLNVGAKQAVGCVSSFHTLLASVVTSICVFIEFVFIISLTLFS